VNAYLGVLPIVALALVVLLGYRKGWWIPSGSHQRHIERRARLWNAVESWVAQRQAKREVNRVLQEAAMDDWEVSFRGGALTTAQIACVRDVYLREQMPSLYTEPGRIAFSQIQMEVDRCLTQPLTSLP
jgi:hypothetical protein